jgi:endonuclease-3
VPEHTPRATLEILAKLEEQHPNADTELRHRNAFELLVATILSAQSTDERVNLVTPALFARYPDARALAAADPAEIERLVLQTGFFRQKTRAIIGMSQALLDAHAGQVPADMDALTELPGVGRKTANVVLGHALGVPGLPVDRHVLRVSNRIGIAVGDNPEVVEMQLTSALPPERWTRASDTLILHGRRICRPNPLCDKCAVRDECTYYRTVIAPEAARDGISTSRRRKKVARTPLSKKTATGGSRASPQRGGETRPKTSRAPARRTKPSSNAASAGRSAGRQEKPAMPGARAHPPNRARARTRGR